MNWFRAPKSGADWFSVGSASKFSNLGEDDTTELKTACRAYHVPPEDSTKSSEVKALTDECSGDEAQLEPDPTTLHEQVIVFQYKGKFHAIDHVRNQAFLPTEREDFPLLSLLVLT